MSAISATRPSTRSKTLHPRAEVLLLARLEAARFARHPLFLVGVALTVVSTVASRNGLENIMSFPVIPAFFLGVFGVIVAGRLTRSTVRSREAIDVAPVDVTARSAAMCLACLVPAAAGLAWSLFVLAWAVAAPPPENTWWFPTLPDTDVLASFVGTSVLAAYGGPVLGVAAARWLRFRGAPVVVALGLVAGTLVITAVSAAGRTRLVAPWALWGTGTNPDGTIGWLGGSPVWYSGYELALCCLAIVAALAWRATSLQSLRRIGVLCTALAVLCATLAITTGPAHEQRRTPPHRSTAPAETG